MAALLQLVLALWAVIGTQTPVYRSAGPLAFTDLYGSPREAEAATACVNGQPEVWLSPEASLETSVHEFAHAYDCLDDGAMNGSPGVRPAQRSAWVSDYCWTSAAEWYACAVVHYRAIQPQSTSAWHAEEDEARAVAADPSDALVTMAEPFAH